MSLITPAAHTRAVVRRVVLAVLAAAALVAAVAPGVALGGQSRLETSSFNGSDTDVGAFLYPGRMAVHRASGTLYAIDTGNGVVDKFDGSGVAQDFSTLGTSSLGGGAVPAPDGPANFYLSGDADVAVDNSGTASDGNVVVLTPGVQTAWVFDSTGAYLHRMTGFGFPCGAAVDSEGHVWISDYYANAVVEYDAAGTATGNSIDTSAQGPVCHIAFDSVDNLYAAHYFGSVEKYDSTGAYVGQIDSGTTYAVAVDPVSDHVFVAHSDRVSEYDSAGIPVTEFGAPSLSGAIGVAVGGAGEVYVSSQGDQRVHVFGPLVTLPDVTTGSASDVEKTTATLNGTVNPDEVEVTDCHFEYVDQADFQANGYANATDVPCMPDPGSGSSDVAVAADVAALTTSTTYHYRLVATNANGPRAGADQTFETKDAVDDLVTGQATDVEPATATLNGSLNPNGEAVTDCHFEYVDDADFQANGYANATDVACAPDPGSGSGTVNVAAQISSLAAATTYHFRLVATNAIGTTEGADQTFQTAPAVKDLATGQATDVEATTATLNGSLDPDGAAITDCHFEYVDDADFQANGYANATDVACAPDPGSGSGSVAVAAQIEGLTRGRTTYHFRLVATNAFGTTQGADQTLITLGAVIDNQASRNVDLDSATLTARINPNGQDTTYHFEYGTDTGYGQSTPETPVGSDTTAHPVTATLTDLTPGTTYHWRTVATNAADTASGPDRTFTTYAPPSGSADCPNQRFRSGPAANLPDCRAYEMVSPVDKNNGDIKPVCNATCFRTSMEQSAVDGNKITYSSYKSFGDSVSAPYSSQYLASRGPTGWSTHGLNPPRNLGDNGGPGTGGFLDLDIVFRAFSADLSIAWLTNNNVTPLTPDAVIGTENVGAVNLYARDNANDSYHALTTENGVKGPELQGRTADGRHVVFGGDPIYIPSVGGEPLYELSDGELEVVNILPDGTPDPGYSILGSRPRRPKAAGYVTTNTAGVVDHAISDDGSRVFWTSRDDATFSVGGDLYVRIDGERTVAISATNDAVFRVASADGSKVIYDNTTGPYGGDGSIYEFDVDAETTRLIANDSQGVLGASDDLSYIYYVSTEDLADGATAGEHNLYLDHNGAKTFIAELSPADVGIAQAGYHVENAPFSVARETLFRNSRVTPDGRRIAFQSTRSLTGYDNTDAVDGRPAVEVFTYDADADRVACASCNPSGARPVGEPLRSPYVGGEGPGYQAFGGEVTAAAWLTTAQSSHYVPRVLLDDGSRLFFNSYDGLVPQDTNGRQDVYQWEEQGSGSCQKPDGCVDLISSGTSPELSEFADASADGSDVFFTTRSSLVPQDTGLIDLYDARVNGGFDPPPAPPAGCEGDDCQGDSPPPDEQKPASSGPGGTGNVAGLPAAAQARFTVVGRAVGRAGFSLRVRVAGKGVIAGSGADVKGVRRRVSKAGTYKLTFKLTDKAKRKLAGKAAPRVSVRVRFVASGGKTSHKTLALRLKQSQKAHKTRAANNSGGAK